MPLRLSLCLLAFFQMLLSLTRKLPTSTIEYRQCYDSYYTKWITPPFSPFLLYATIFEYVEEKYKSAPARRTLSSYKKKILMWGVWSIWVVVTIFLGYHYFRNNHSTEQQTTALKAKLDKHIDFGGVEPSYATITDAVALKGQDPFYQKSQNGDRLILWDKKAFLYRPKTDRIIDIGVVVASSPAPANTNSPIKK